MDRVSQSLHGNKKLRPDVCVCGGGGRGDCLGLIQMVGQPDALILGIPTQNTQVITLKGQPATL